MKSSLLLSAALALLLPAAMPAHAQTQSGGVDSGPANTRAAKRAAEAKAHAATKQEPLYPQATRTFPEQQASKALAKPLSALFDLQEKDGKEDEIIAKADAILANNSASPFDKSSAAYMAASAWERKGDANANAQALKYYQLAIDNNGLHNNGHYTAMLHVAQLNAADEHFDQALAAVDKFIAETKSEDPNVWSMKVSYLQNMDHPKEAIDAMQKLLASKPNDKRLMMSMAAAYQQAGDDAKAGQMFDKMRAAGMLTESKDYEAGYHLLFNIEGRQKDALALIDEGLKKGILQPSYDMYVITGRAATEADDTAGAIAAYSKGAPMGKDGTMFLNLAQLQIQEKQYAQAKAAAQGAKDKGVPPKLMGLYWRSVAQAENGLGNAAATKAALTEAAKYPEYKKWAEAGLRQGLAK